MIIPGTLCPMTRDGRHKLKPFHGRTGARDDAPVASGLACERCHKTWIYRGDDLVPTYPEDGHDHG